MNGDNKNQNDNNDSNNDNNDNQNLQSCKIIKSLKWNEKFSSKSNSCLPKRRERHVLWNTKATRNKY